MHAILPVQMVYFRIGCIFLVFFTFSAFAEAEESTTPSLMINCYGKGELKCDEALKCENNEYQDVRMASTGCCQKCVQMIGTYAAPAENVCIYLMTCGSKLSSRGMTVSFQK